MTHPEYILTLSCLDQRGIVHRVSGFLADHGCNIIDSAQFGDAQSKLFFMRVHFSLEEAGVSDGQLRSDFAALGDTMQMNWQLHDAHKKPRMLIMVSKIGHCLNDLLFRYKSGLLPVEIPAIVSNHTDFYQLSASYNIPFHHLPLAPGASAAAKRAQEDKVLEIIRDCDVDLVVLARYMQILSPEMCGALKGRAINIHHSFLPEHRGKGFGEALLRDLMDEAAASGKAISIHVEKQNPAMRLYQRLGFVTEEDKGIHDLMRWKSGLTDAGRPREGGDP